VLPASHYREIVIRQLPQALSGFEDAARDFIWIAGFCRRRAAAVPPLFPTEDGVNEARGRRRAAASRIAVCASRCALLDAQRPSFQAAAFQRTERLLRPTTVFIFTLDVMLAAGARRSSLQRVRRWRSRR